VRNRRLSGTKPLRFGGIALARTTGEGSVTKFLGKSHPRSEHFATSAMNNGHNLAGKSPSQRGTIVVLTETLEIGLSYTEIPTHLLRAELHRRQQDAQERPACGTKGGKGHYNTSLHVFALFLILVLSTAGTYTVHDAPI
jgi:hypothetical protein